MSIKIGIVSEGVSDYWALKHITERYLKEMDVYTIALKPKITKQGKQGGFGTWQGVFEYIKGEDKLILEAVNEGCQFVIIQIDTDVCEQYGVSKNDKDVKALWVNVQAKIKSSIHPDFEQSILIYAICIHELECWLIPFVCTDNKKCAKINQCLNPINDKIKAKETIDKHNKNDDKVRPLYDFILNKKKKPIDIKDCSSYNIGFQSFIYQLDRIKEKL
ncbi:MAG: hypothetical protein LBO74_03950 [Candidatus Symbiothrix sp.]|jgi:hypothetical protein|nr:hypothetical protein [Candidatus Symbiothrix sp.]